MSVSSESEQTISSNSWLDNIVYARFNYVFRILGRDRPLSIDPVDTSNKFWRTKSKTTGPSGSPQSYESFDADEMKILLKLEDLILSDKRISRALPKAIFDRLPKFTKRIQNERVKQVYMIYIFIFSFSLLFSFNIISFIHSFEFIDFNSFQLIHLIFIIVGFWFSNMGSKIFIKK